MTPLEQAQQQQKKGCDTCAKRVVLRPHGASYCKASGKLLLPSLLNCGQCAHVPSEYEPKGDDMKTRENEVHEPRITKNRAWLTAYCQICEGKVATVANCSGEPDEEIIAEYLPNYCPNCGARLKEVDE